MTLYRGDHRSQYDPGASARLRKMGCTPTSLANAERCATGGAVNLTGDQVLALVKIDEETSPGTVGWSLADAQLAASRIPGAPALRVTEGPWDDVVKELNAGFAVMLQGDSDVFLTGCSGQFDGNHCIMLHPDTVSGKRWIGDPICGDWRPEREDILQQYSEKFAGVKVRYGVVQRLVPEEVDGMAYTYTTLNDAQGKPQTGGLAKNQGGFDYWDFHSGSKKGHVDPGDGDKATVSHVKRSDGNIGSLTLTYDFVLDSQAPWQAPASGPAQPVNEQAIRQNQKDLDRAAAGKTLIP